MTPRFRLPTPAEIRSALQPRVLRDDEFRDEYEVIRFLYELDDEGDGSIEMVYRHRETGERTGFRFRGVKLPFILPIRARDDGRLVVVNNALLKWEKDRHEPRMLEVRYDIGDGLREVIFWAAGVEDC